MKEMCLLVLDKNIINITPSPEHLRNIVKDTASRSLAIARQKTQNRILHFSDDAGNKDGINHIVKETVTWDLDEDAPFSFTLDCDACQGANEKNSTGF